MTVPRSAPAVAIMASLAVVVLGACSGAGTAGPPGATDSAVGTVGPGATASEPAATSTSPATPAPATLGPAGPAAGTSRVDDHGVSQVWVPPGTFRIGTPRSAVDAPAWVGNEWRGEQPAQEVLISQGFWLDQTEVTNESYEAFIADHGYTTEALWSPEGWRWLQGQASLARPRDCAATAPTMPRLCVTWFEAEAYAAWRGGRLPTEAEWEYAARGPESAIYPWGDEYDPALLNGGGATGPAAVGSYPAGASWVGALDMAGNAMEWVADWYSEGYRAKEVHDNPPGPDTGSIKIEKGGWWGAPDAEYVTRAAYRHFEDPPMYSDHHIGFRVVVE